MVRSSGNRVCTGQDSGEGTDPQSSRPDKGRVETRSGQHPTCEEVEGLRRRRLRLSSPDCFPRDAGVGRDFRVIEFLKLYF